MNVAIGAVDPPPAEDLGKTLGTLNGERWIAVHDAARETAPVAAVILLERKAGLSLETQQLSSSPLALAPYMLGLPDEQESDARRRFALYSDLVDSAMLLRLSADLADRPAELVDAIERSLDLSALLAVEGAA